MQEKTYTKQEVQELLEPLMKQIEFYNKQNIQLKTYIREHWIPFGKKSEFLTQVIKEEDESDTIIFNIVKHWSYAKQTCKNSIK